MRFQLLTVGLRDLPPYLLDAFRATLEEIATADLLLHVVDASNPAWPRHLRAVNETLGRINGSLGEPGWVPIHYVTSSYPRHILAGLYRLAQVGLVTPMREGMNLVAKEYVAAQDPENPGVLILSKFAGAAEQLTDALIVNPNDRFEVAEAIRTALYMSLEERIARWNALMKALRASARSWMRTAWNISSNGVSPVALTRGARVPP